MPIAVEADGLEPADDLAPVDVGDYDTILSPAGRALVVCGSVGTVEIITGSGNQRVIPSVCLTPGRPFHIKVVSIVSGAGTTATDVRVMT